MLPSFRYARPARLEEALAQLAAPGARIHAGGTDLLGCLRDQVFPADRVVSLSALASLRGIAPRREGGLRIGALTTITEVTEHPEVRRLYPLLASAAAEVASPQLRHQGTLGGNLCQKPRCWYYRGEFHCLRKGGGKCYAVGGENQFHCILGGSRCFIVHPSDTAPALVALGATVRAAGPSGLREIRVEELHVPPAVDPQRETVLGHEEILTEILLPPPMAGTRDAFRKVRARRSWDFAVAGTALLLRFEEEEVRDARIVLSGAAPVPWRAKNAEEALRGRKLTPESAGDAAEAALEGARPLKRNGYKLPLFRGLLRAELLALASGA